MKAWVESRSPRYWTRPPLGEGFEAQGLVACVRSYMNPEVGSTLQLGIRLPDEGTIHIAAEVMWAAEHGERIGFGARFLSRSAGSSFSDQGEAVHSIRRYVQSLAPAAEAEWANA